MFSTKRLAISLILSLFMVCLRANAEITFQFRPGTIASDSLKTTMERNISALLSEIDRAGNDGVSLNLSGIAMDSNAKDRLNALWNESSRFVCSRNSYISKCLTDFQGYQVRAIPVTMKPVDSSYDGSLNRELTISLDRRGNITGVRPAWKQNEDVSTILNTTGAGETNETAIRREILKWLEDYSSYYQEKNIKALEKVFNDGALNIKGGDIEIISIEDTDSISLEKKVAFTAQAKRQFIKTLKEVWRLNKIFDISFDHISVNKHPSISKVVGVTLHQKWSSACYSDAGWLFLLWDFNDPATPKIHVRTWQPESTVATDGVFTIDDFYIF